jgi:hypothetical protein
MLGCLIFNDNIKIIQKTVWVGGWKDGNETCFKELPNKAFYVF